MKIHVIGIKRIKGDKSKAGNPYDMPAFLCQVPIETVSNTEKGFWITGKGDEISEIPYDPKSISPVDIENLPFVRGGSLYLELEIESQPRFGKFESICVGFKLLPAMLKVA